MTPPIAQDETVKEDVSLTQWINNGSFDTAAKCFDQKISNLRDEVIIEGGVAVTSVEKVHEMAKVESYGDSLCIATDDRRLGKK